jgi:hypothetical protein
MQKVACRLLTHVLAEIILFSFRFEKAVKIQLETNGSRGYSIIFLWFFVIAVRYVSVQVRFASRDLINYTN